AAAAAAAGAECQLREDPRLRVWNTLFFDKLAGLEDAQGSIVGKHAAVSTAAPAATALAADWSPPLRIKPGSRAHRYRLGRPVPPVRPTVLFEGRLPAEVGGRSESPLDADA
ncbi:unnamed protein product, partial [Phaeothamnion confervicola]